MGCKKYGKYVFCGLSFCEAHNKYGEQSKVIKGCCKYGDCYEIPTYGYEKNTHCEKHAHTMMKRDPFSKCATEYCEGKKDSSGLCCECRNYLNGGTPSGNWKTKERTIADYI